MSNEAELREEDIKIKRHKDKIIDILAKTVKLGIESLLDSRKWKYCWDEMAEEEQEEVKRIAIKMDKVLGFYERFKK